MPLTKAKDSRKNYHRAFMKIVGWPLLLNALKFGDGFQIFGTAGCALHVDQPLQPEAETFDPWDLDSDGVREQLFVTTSTYELAH